MVDTYEFRSIEYIPISSQYLEVNSGTWVVMLIPLLLSPRKPITVLSLVYSAVLQRIIFLKNSSKTCTDNLKRWATQSRLKSVIIFVVFYIYNYFDLLIFAVNLGNKLFLRFEFDKNILIRINRVVRRNRNLSWITTAVVFRWWYSDLGTNWYTHCYCPSRRLDRWRKLLFVRLLL